MGGQSLRVSSDWHKKHWLIREENMWRLCLRCIRCFHAPALGLCLFKPCQGVRKEATAGVVIIGCYYSLVHHLHTARSDQPEAPPSLETSESAKLSKKTLQSPFGRPHSTDAHSPHGLESTV